LHGSSSVKICIVKLSRLLLLGLVFWARSVEARDSLPLDTRSCVPGPLSDAFLEALRVELAADELATSPPARLTLCDIAAGHVQVVRSGKTTHIDVSDVPELARPRTAAVAVAETLRWWTDQPQGEADAPGEQLPRSPSGEPNASRAPAVAPEELGPFGVDLGLRAMALGPERTLFWGAAVHGFFRPHRWFRATLGAGYLTSSADSELGSLRVHVLDASGALDVTLARTHPEPFPVEARLGIGAEWLDVTAVAKSDYGFDEPHSHAWALLADGHVAVAMPLQRVWFLSFNLAAVKDLRGVVLQAGGEDVVSLYGWGVSSELRVERPF